MRAHVRAPFEGKRRTLDLLELELSMNGGRAHEAHPSLKWLPEMGRKSTFPQGCNPERLPILLQMVPHHSQKATASCPVGGGAEIEGAQEGGREKPQRIENWRGEGERIDQNTLHRCMKFSIKGKMLKKI